MTLTEQILRVAGIYQAAVQLPDTTVSWRMFGESRTLSALRNGTRTVTLVRAEGAIAALSAAWPDGAVWPADIARPTHQPSSPGAPSTAIGAPPSGPPAQPAGGPAFPSSSEVQA